MKKSDRKSKPLEIAEVGAFARRSREDVSRRLAALIEIFEMDPDFAALKKKFETINLVDDRDFLMEDYTYDVVILHSILSPSLPLNFSPHIEKECRVSHHHHVDAWRERLVTTDAKYIVVCEGQPYTLSGWELGDLPGYSVVKRDQWLTVYRKKRATRPSAVLSGADNVKKKLSLTFEFFKGEDRYSVVAYHMDVKVGEIGVDRHEDLPSENPDPHTPCYQVTDIEVAEPMRRRGIATALYLAAAEVAFSEGFSLCSDEATSLSEEAEAVWESLSCAYWEVPGDIDDNFDYGRYVIPKPSARKS